MSPTSSEPALLRPRTVPGRLRAVPFEGRLRLALQTLAVALQVAWFTLRGWAGAALALLPVVLDGGPAGRRTGPRIRLLPAPAATREA